MSLPLLTFLVWTGMLSLVAAWGYNPAMVLLTGARGTFSSHFPAWRGPHDEHKALLWARGCGVTWFPQVLPSQPPQEDLLSPLFLSSVSLWCGACSSACATWLLLKLQVAVLIYTSQGASLSCWCIILNDENIRSAWLFLIRTAIIFCGDVISLLIN